jgi:hypothetical protein
MVHGYVIRMRLEMVQGDRMAVVLPILSVSVISIKERLERGSVTGSLMMGMRKLSSGRNTSTRRQVSWGENLKRLLVVRRPKQGRRHYKCTLGAGIRHAPWRHRHQYMLVVGS